MLVLLTRVNSFLAALQARKVVGARVRRNLAGAAHPRQADADSRFAGWFIRSVT